MSKLLSVTLSNVTVGWSALCRPIRHKSFQSSTYFKVLFKENYNFPRVQRGSNIFRGGGGQNLPGGGGGSKHDGLSYFRGS